MPCRDITSAMAILTGHSKTMAVIPKKMHRYFRQRCAAELGYASYGDVEYVPHVLRYYVMNEETSVSNESAKTILEELKKNNTAPAEAWDVVEKGASLIGSVKYSMEKRQADGRDKPEFFGLFFFFRHGHFIRQE